MNILITGGAGFIGSHLSRQLIEQKHKVLVIDNLVTGSKKNINDLMTNNNFKFIKADIINFDFSLIKDQFDLIYDLASPASPKVFKSLSNEILRVNSLGLLNLLDFMVNSHSQRLVFASTSEVYGDPHIHPQPETYLGNVNSYGPRSCYDEGKRFAESCIFSYIQKYKLDIRIARIFNTYGPFMDKDDGRVISNFINQAINNQPITIYGDGLQTRSCCYVDDMVNGLILLGTIDKINGQVINIGNPDEKTIKQMADIIIRLTGSKSVISNLPIGQDDPKKRCPDISRAKKLLNWGAKIDFETGLKKTIEYFKNL